MKRSLSAGVVLSLFLSPLCFGQSTTQPSTPSTPPVAGSFEAYQTEGTAAQKEYKLLVPDNNFLADSNIKRSEVAAKAIPLLKLELVDLEGMARTKAMYKGPVVPVITNAQAQLYVFGDPETVSTFDRDMQKPGRDGLRAKRVVLRARWYMAGADADKLAHVVADVDQMAVVQPTDEALTLLVGEIATAATDPAIKQNMVDLLNNTLDNRMCDSVLTELRHHDKVQSFEGKPMVIAGKLPDGKDFTTADWKGKVVLVDFWAAWCGPCKAELPRVQNVYNQYHDKGFEVLGVDNDYTAKSVIAYTAKANLPWPQLFDEAAGAKDAWNPITLGYGINGIPVMFLIDKKGVCRTVTARDNFEKMIPQMLAE